MNDAQDYIFWYAKCTLHFRLGVFKLTKFIQYIWSFGSKYSIKLSFFSYQYVVGDEKARAHLEEVMQKVVKLMETLSMILGWARAGKTHIVALALKKPPLGVRVSTPCAGAPIRASKQVHVTEGTDYFKEIAELEYLSEC